MVVKTFGKTDVRSVEKGQQRMQPDVDGQKYRITCAHVHIMALALAMVGTCFHIIMSYEYLKKKIYYRLVRHVPCALLFVLVIAGNRLYKQALYLLYLIFELFFVAFIIIAEALRQYQIRTDPHHQGQHRHTIYFFIMIWLIVATIELCIYYVIYRDWVFVRDVHKNPPRKVQTIRYKNRTEPVVRY